MTQEQIGSLKKELGGKGIGFAEQGGTLTVDGVEAAKMVREGYVREGRVSYGVPEGFPTTAKPAPETPATKPEAQASKPEDATYRQNLNSLPQKAKASRRRIRKSRTPKASRNKQQPHAEAHGESSKPASAGEENSQQQRATRCSPMPRMKP